MKKLPQLYFYFITTCGNVVCSELEAARKHTALVHYARENLEEFIKKGKDVWISSPSIYYNTGCIRCAFKICFAFLLLQGQIKGFC